MSTSEQSDIFLENIVRNIPQFVFWKDIHSVYLGCNENYARLIGLSDPRDVVGLTDYEIGWQKDGDSPDLFREGDSDTIAGRHIINQEEWLSLPNQQKILVLVNKSPITNQKGKVLGVLGIATDITARKKLQMELAETQKREQIAKETRLRVGANIAHEVRNPLTNISFSTERLAKHISKLVMVHEAALENNLSLQYLNENELKNLFESLEIINREVQHADTLIGTLLETAKGTSSNVASFSEFQISDCIESALSRLPHLLSRLAQVVHWDKRHDFSVIGPKLCITHVIFNLLKNALEFTKTVQNPAIYITITQEKGWHHLSIKDNGDGIPKENLPQLFKEFFSTRDNGNGVGLAFCKQVMVDLGGQITCQSEFGEFAEFTLKFPTVVHAKQVLQEAI